MTKNSLVVAPADPIRYQLLAQPIFVHCCYRADCQRLTGSALVLNAITETQTIKLLLGKPVAMLVARENGSVRS